MSIKFDPIGSVTGDVDEIKRLRNEMGIGLIEAKRLYKAMQLHDLFVRMRYDIGEYEKSTTEEKFNDLLDVLIGSVEY